MPTAVCMIFFHRPAFGLAQAAQVLAATRLSLVRGEDHIGDPILVRWGLGPVLAIRFADGPWVQQEATEIGRTRPYAAIMRACNQRFEISCSDRNAVLDEINILIEVQIILQAATQGFLFNAWNGTLFAPGMDASPATPYHNA